MVIIYVTNQGVGAEADDLKKELRKDYRFILDLRDRDWFLERRNLSVQTQSASSHLVEKVATPITASREIVKGKSLGLNEIEARAALVYLNLQWEDDTREKGLTKLCFEALVRSVLRESDSENRLPRSEIRKRVRQILYTHSAEQVDQYTDAALKRLNKKYIRHWKQLDEFCLAHHETLRLRDRLTELEHADRKLQADLKGIIQNQSRLLKKRLSEAQAAATGERLRRILEKLLLSRGELFVSSIHTKNLDLPADNLQASVIQDLGEHPDSAKVGEKLMPLLIMGLTELLSSTSDSSRRYLRSLSDSYTLMAFLRETPDVQSAITKMFSEAAVWLDTNIILPVFAETLLEPIDRKFHKLLRAALEFGLKLHITSGVLEELERHTNRCLAYTRNQGTWEGRVPFLVSMYAATGRSLAGFASWIEFFRGDKRPAEDLAEFLESEINITQVDLSMNSAPRELRLAVQEIFYEAKEKKERADGAFSDPIALNRLVTHDVENYIGVIVQRKQEKYNPFGYTAWWLTLDKTAFTIGRQLKDRIQIKPPASPVMSPDFLVNYLAFGPRRGRISKNTEARLPLSFGLGAVDFMPPELFSLAERIRAEMKDLPERIIRRRVRDELDAARAREGTLAYGGLAQIEDDLLQSLSEQQQIKKTTKGSN